MSECKNKECPSQGRYARGCVKYLDKDGCFFHSNNPIISNSVDKKQIAALTTERDTLRVERKISNIALGLAGAMLAEHFESCPYHLFYHTDKKFTCIHESVVCDMQKNDTICWFEYFITKATEEQE